MCKSPPIFLLLALILTMQSFAEQSVYVNGRIYTSNPEQPWAEAMIIDEEEIAFVGSTADAENHVKKRATRIDLDGKFLMPGIIDGHTHPGLVAILAEEETGASLPQDSKESLMKFLTEYSKNAEGFIVTMGEWNVEHFLPHGPHKRDLDAIFPNKPVILFDNSGHTTWLNSRALAMFKITKDTPDVSDDISYFVRDENGEPTGWAKEFALIPYVGNTTLPSRDYMKTIVKRFVDFLSSRGVTTLMDAGSLEWSDEIYDVVAELESEGNLPVRYEGSYHIYDPKQLDGAVDAVMDYRKRFGGKLLTFNTVKIHYDGVLEVNTAGQLEPYENLPKSRGGILVETDRLTQFILELSERKVDLHMHTVGDRSTRSALDAVQAARAELGKALEINVSLSHLEQVADQDIKRFAALDVSANFTPHWFGGYFKGADQAIGTEQNRYSQRAKTFVQSGANVTFSSDVTTLPEHYRADPWFGMQTGVNRQNVGEGKDAPIFGFESERLDIEDLIVGYTRNAAKEMGRLDFVGTLEVGKKADFIITNQNPFEVDSYSIHKVEPTAVYMNGRQVNE